MGHIKNDSIKIRELITKVKVLSERGEKGERDNAKAKLSVLLEKYNISKFEESKFKERSFKLVDFEDCMVIMVHCILDAKKDCAIIGDKKRKELYCELTDEQYIDVCEKFNHYYPEFHKQKELFTKAFIIKNDLGIADGDSDVTEDEINGINKVISGIIQKPYVKKHKQNLISN